MLNPDTPFPQVGSYALHQDPALPPEQRKAELVRILQRNGDEVLLAYPLRDGAAGNQRVPLAQLTDATALSPDEKRELVDLSRYVRDRRPRTAKQKRDHARQLELRNRELWNGCLRRQLDRLARQQRAKAAA